MTEKQILHLFEEISRDTLGDLYHHNAPPEALSRSLGILMSRFWDQDIKPETLIAIVEEWDYGTFDVKDAIGYFKLIIQREEGTDAHTVRSL